MVGVAPYAQPKARSPESANSSTLSPCHIWCRAASMITREDTAKHAFAKAIELHVVEKLFGVSIYDGARMYSIDEFASAMSLQEIANTVEAAAAKANDASD